MSSNATFDVHAFLAMAGIACCTHEFRRGQVVYAQGDIADAVFYVRSGMVKITVVSDEGREAVTAILGDGNFLGEACLAGQERRSSTATAMGRTVVFRFERDAIVRIIHERPEFSDRFIAHILSRNIRAEEDLVDQLFNSSEKRLARTLLLLARFGKDGSPGTVIPKVSQETLAEMIGTTRARVSVFMNKFRKLGYIDYNGEIEVHRDLLNVLLPERPPGQRPARRAD